jgi:hypothetical protein
VLNERLIVGGPQRINKVFDIMIVTLQFDHDAAKFPSGVYIKDHQFGRTEPIFCVRKELAGENRLIGSGPRRTPVAPLGSPVSSTRFAFFAAPVLA